MGQKKESKHRIGEKKDIIVQKKYRMGQKAIGAIERNSSASIKGPIGI